MVLFCTENLQEGVAGFGNSIIQSALNFLEELRKTKPDGMGGNMNIPKPCNCGHDPELIQNTYGMGR